MEKPPFKRGLILTSQMFLCQGKYRMDIGKIKPFDRITESSG